MKTNGLLMGAVVALIAWIVPLYGGQLPGNVVATGSIATVAATNSPAAQENTSWQRPRTSWGHPDLQGIWTNFDRTPFERPLPVNSAPRRNTGAAGVGPSPDFSQDWAHVRLSPVRPSVVVDPPNGRVPVRPEAEAMRDYDLARITDSWEYQSPWERCITRGVPGGMFPSDYNNAVRIFQTPDSVIIFQEMIHETRIIPVDGRPHIPSNVPQWMGDSRGHWEGDTLVVETTHFDDRAWIANNNATGRMKGIHSTADLRVVERFIRVNANTINWQATIEDPKVYTSAWTVAMPLNLELDYKMFEYACHEGNHAMPNTLSAGRAEDAAAAKTK
jgi:hypothetical protein